MEYLTDLFGIADPESEMMKLDKPSPRMLKVQREGLLWQMVLIRFLKMCDTFCCVLTLSWVNLEAKSNISSVLKKDTKIFSLPATDSGFRPSHDRILFQKQHLQELFLNSYLLSFICIACLKRTNGINHYKVIHIFTDHPTICTVTYLPLIY